MAVRVYTLDNVSKQPVSVVCQQGTAAAVGDVPQTHSGMLTIQPGKNVTIEADRVNFGQIKNLKAMNLVSISEGLA